MTKTKLMAILNITPDSFHDGGRWNHTETAIEQGLKLIQHEGADILDIGGESSRPGSTPVSEQEEIDRVCPVIEGITKESPTPISIDTCKPTVAEAALEAGASEINDITGFSDPAMRLLAAKYATPIYVMHMQGTPKTMQKNPHYKDGVISDLMAWFRERVESLLEAGVKKENIVLDPGFGFGKTVENNLEILQNLLCFKGMGFPLLVGLSRKSFMSRTLGCPSSELLSATLAMNTVAIMNGADVIRVHDVAEHRKVIDMVDAYRKVE